MTCALLAAGTLVLVYLSWQQMRAAEPPARVMPGALSAPMAEAPGEGGAARFDAGEGRGLWGLAGDPAEWQASVLAGGDPSIEPMEDEPAGLAPPPGGERAWGFERKTEAGRAAVAAWRVEGGRVGDLAAFYGAQADERGFEPMSPRDARGGADADGRGTADARVLNFARWGTAAEGEEAVFEVLTVRLARREASIHALIALR